MRGSFFLTVGLLVIVAGMTIKPLSSFFDDSTTEKVNRFSLKDTANLADRHIADVGLIQVPGSDGEETILSDDYGDSYPGFVSSLCLSDYRLHGLESGLVEVSYTEQIKRWGIAMGETLMRKFKGVVPLVQKFLTTNAPAEDSIDPLVQEEPSEDFVDLSKSSDSLYDCEMWLYRPDFTGFLAMEEIATNATVKKPRYFVFVVGDSVPLFCKVLPLMGDWLLTAAGPHFSDPTNHFFTQVPYFRQYGYLYVMDDKSENQSGMKTDEDTFITPSVPDFVLNPINGVIGPDTEEDDPDTWSDEYEDEEVDVSYEEEPYEEEPYGELYRSYVPKDYAIEYEAYEVDEFENSNTDDSSEEGATDGTTTTTDQQDELTIPSSTGWGSVDYGPLRKDADYYYEVEFYGDESLPSDPAGNFDIYWTSPDPNVL
jgi:hypothetical protein